ncbi:MAG: sugar phosphate nucleotidyltransferase [Thermoplasmata archaeon]
MKAKVLILAGGSGTRLWPLSRENYPKQFLKLFDNKSFLRMTYERALKLVEHKDIVVITHKSYRNNVINDLFPYEGYSLLTEDYRKNTGPAIALGMVYLKDVLKVQDDEVVFVLASDHFIKPEEKFVEYLKFAYNIAKDGYVVAFGIRPSRPEENFGYIKAGTLLEEKDGFKAYTIEHFIEKPNKETAQKFFEAGSYFWNSGNFALSLGTAFEEFKLNAPEIHELMAYGYDEFVRDYHKLPEKAFDYIEMEKTKKGVVVPMEDILWSDVGSFDGLYSLMEKNERENVCVGKSVCFESENSLVYANSKLVCLLDVKDITVIEDRDVVLVMKKGSGGKVRDLVKLLKDKNYKEAYFHIENSFEWGTELILEEGNGYKICKLNILPNKSIGPRIHMHHNRSWIVLKGTLYIEQAKGNAGYYTSGDVVHVYKTNTYSIKNVGLLVAELLEIRMGEYVEDNDTTS